MRRLRAAFVTAAKEFMEDKVPRLAASLSYYTIFSLPPLLVTVIAVAGLVFGADEVREQLVGQLGGLVGSEPANVIGEAVRDAEQIGSGLALAIGVTTLLLGASGVFGQLQDALNTVWDVEPQEGRGVVRFIRSRLLSFASVLGAGFLLLVSLSLSAAIAAIVDTFERFDSLAPFLAALDLAASFVVITLVFAMIFKFLPDVDLKWKDVWWGAGITSALFVVGKFAIGFYLGTSDVGSAYGAAGSLIIVLVWIYYSSLILFYGAELTQAWTAGAAAEPDPRPPVVRPANQPAGAVPTALAWVGIVIWGWLSGRKRNSPSSGM